ncbi:aromatic ring-hydroxylating dioxygenase subunit alpha [Bacillus sp. ISL-77]|uniref:aromatic ring-hydroxylating oxygenase subunit alpha n=1 Tax=Bacillus sp. ISL-77 TaxID=2819138 RepID=UPI001BE8B85F|nr:aromatic ring-hydroxylating dioxygenase subunit alpha [Bacillus sp. ISL-77]MBT2739944.1 Rieske 2Fe-2S domain-containing protein [Bacillus sp. ISL-77]
MSNYLKEDQQKCLFKVNREVFIDPEILEIERKEIFDKCWLYIGHESEVPNKGDFHRRKVGGRNLLFTRGNDGVIRALYNTCPHRGALVCREGKGNSKVFRCFYHAWSFNTQGELVGLPDKFGFLEDHNCDGSKNMLAVKQLESYRGFVFVNFDDNAISLEEYLAGAKEYLDLVADQTEVGMEVLQDSQEYSVRSNWKLLCENSFDLYHGVPTHKTYFDIVATRGGIMEKDSLAGEARALGNGHAVMEYYAPWPRPIGKWIEGYGEEAKEIIDKINARLVEKFGEERAHRISKKNRNILIFPNLVINDIMAIAIRTFYPIEPGYMQVTAYALSPINETDGFREVRNDSYLEFLGPGGFATPDDNEALELCQEGFLNTKEVGWNDISKGMNREIPQATDEEQMRAFWREWDKRMTVAESKKEEAGKVEV